MVIKPSRSGISYVSTSILILMRLRFFLLQTTLAVSIFALFSCDKEPSAPIVKTEWLRETSLFGVKVVGNVKDDGGDKNTERGICYGTRPLPDLSDNVLKADVNGYGAFAFEIEDLKKGSSFYFRAWARNSAGLSFGEVVGFSTSDVPSVTTADPSEITGATAFTGGNVISDGGKPISERGICFDTVPEPDISDNLTLAAEASKGEFTVKLIDLYPSKKYYYRAYAKNAAGVGYGETKTFVTTVLYAAGDSIFDQEGTKYPTIKILGKRWMAANLKTSKYRDGTAVTSIISNTEWPTNTTGACCIYDNTPANNGVYGKLYNWYTTVNAKNLCPTGWKVPSDSDWENLITYLGDVTKAGLKMRTTGTSLWTAPNEGATNSSGFSGVPGGSRSYFGGYGFKGTAAYFWTSDEQNSGYAKFRSLNYDNPTVTDGYDAKKVGMSIRCIEE